MELSTYQEHLSHLIKDPAEILATLNPEKVGLWHLASALQGELAELADAMDKDNHLEEFGDAQFYLQGLALCLDSYWAIFPAGFDPYYHVPLWQDDFNHYDYPWNTQVHWKCQLVIAAGELFDAIKKHVIYNKPVTPEQYWKLREDWKAIRHLLNKNANDAQYFGWSEAEVRQANIDKLAKRYPEMVYRDTYAQQRLDKQQLNVEGTETHRVVNTVTGDGIYSTETELRGESELPNESSGASDTGDSGSGDGVSGD